MRAAIALLSLACASACVTGDEDFSALEQEVALPAPTNLTATVASATRVNLAWDATPGAAGYIVMRGFSPGTETNLTTTPASPTTFSATHLTPSTLYCFQVKNYNSLGQKSAPSNEVCVTTDATTVPTAPANVTAMAVSDSRIRIAWDSVPGAAKYYVNRSTSGGPYARIISVAQPTTMLEDVGLAPSTTYSYTVETVLADNSNSAPSSPPATATTFGLNVQGYWKFNHISGSSAADLSGYGRNASLSGGAVFDTQRAPIDERDNRSLLITANAMSTAQVPVASSSAFVMAGTFTLTLWVHPQAAGDLSIIGMRGPGCTTMGWELAQSAADQLYFRNSLGIRSFGTSLPVGAWTHVAVTHSGGTMRLYLNGQPVASGPYMTASFSAMPLQIGHPGACAGGAAFIDETSIYSRELSAAEIQVLGERPPAPVNLVAAQRTSTSMQLDWEPVANAQRYILALGTTSAPGQLPHYTSLPPTPSDVADHLQAGTTYFFQVRSVRNNLISEYSNEATNMTYPAPVAPSNLMSSPVSSTRINLSWSPEPRATKYFINESVNGGPFVRKTSVTGTTYQAVNLQPGTTYSYTVQTYDTGLLTSSASAPVSATTL